MAEDHEHGSSQIDVALKAGGATEKTQAGALGKRWHDFRVGLRLSLLAEVGDRTRYDWFQIFGSLLMIGSFLVLGTLIVAQKLLASDLLQQMGILAAGNLIVGALIMALPRWGIEDVDLEARLDQIDDPLIKETLESLGVKTGKKKKRNRK